MVARRAAYLVSGGTGTGKTTLLAALLGEVPPGERIVVVEDASELRPRHPHVVALEARPANLEGAGAIDLAVLVRQALRMRPDRLVVGEVRDADVVELLAALNTGHEGGLRHGARELRDPTFRRGWRPWPSPPAWVAPQRTASSPRPSTSCCTSPAVRAAGRRLAQLAVPRRRVDGLVEMRRPRGRSTTGPGSARPRPGRAPRDLGARAS